MLVVWRGATELMIVSTGFSNLIVLLDRLGYSVAAAALLGHLAKDMEFGYPFGEGHTPVVLAALGRYRLGALE